MKFDIGKFSFAELTANSNGKTSGSGTIGIYIVIVSMLCFVYGCFEFHWSGKADVMMYASANVVIGASLLGYRKSVDKNGTGVIPEVTPKKATPNPVDKPEETPEV